MDWDPNGNIQRHQEYCQAMLACEHYNALNLYIYLAMQRACQHKAKALRQKMESLKTLDNRGNTNKLVHNLSSKTLTNEQTMLLQRDTSLNLTDAQPVDFATVLEPIVQHIEANDETKNSIRQRVTGLLMNHRQHHVLSAAEKEALEELWKEDSITILPADKGRATMVMDKPEYDRKIYTLLSDKSAYWIIDGDLMTTLRNRLSRIVDKLKRQGKICEKAFKAIQSKDSALARFYGLLKIHKEGPPLRPIVSFRGTPTFSLAVQ